MLKTVKFAVYVNKQSQGYVKMFFLLAKRLETAKNFQILGRASEGDVAALNEKSRRLSSRERKNT